jgi:hypothetical protein
MIEHTKARDPFNPEIATLTAIELIPEPPAV